MSKLCSQTELEFAKTNIALGLPVDASLLIAIAEDALDALECGEATQEAESRACEAEHEAGQLKTRLNNLENSFKSAGLDISQLGNIAREYRMLCDNVKLAIIELSKPVLTKKARLWEAGHLKRALPADYNKPVVIATKSLSR